MVTYYAEEHVAGESEFEPVKLGFFDKAFIAKGAKGVAKFGGPRAARRRYSTSNNNEK